MPASDVYSAAAVLFHLLSGHPVFGGTNAVSLVRAHRSETAPALEGHGKQLKELLARALDKNPAERPPDAGAFLTELEGAAMERFGGAWLSKAMYRPSELNAVASLLPAAGRPSGDVGLPESDTRLT